jgi:hypothetical protein
MSAACMVKQIQIKVPRDFRSSYEYLISFFFKVTILVLVVRSWSIYRSNVGCPDKGCLLTLTGQSKLHLMNNSTHICKCWICSFNCRGTVEDSMDHRIELMMFPSSSSNCNHPERRCTGRICCVSFLRGNSRVT